MSRPLTRNAPFVAVHLSSGAGEIRIRGSGDFRGSLVGIKDKGGGMNDSPGFEFEMNGRFGRPYRLSPVTIVRLERFALHMISCKR